MSPQQAAFRFRTLRNQVARSFTEPDLAAGGRTTRELLKRNNSLKCPQPSKRSDKANNPKNLLNQVQDFKL